MTWRWSLVQVQYRAPPKLAFPKYFQLLSVDIFFQNHPQNNQNHKIYQYVSRENSHTQEA